MLLFQSEPYLFERTETDGPTRDGEPLVGNKKYQGEPKSKYLSGYMMCTIYGEVLQNQC